MQKVKRVRIQGAVTLFWISALVPSLASQFRLASPDFDDSGKPRVNVESDDGQHRVQSFESSWTVMAPRFALETSTLSIVWASPREPRPGHIVFSGSIEVSGRETEQALGWYQGFALLVSKLPLDFAGDPNDLERRAWTYELGYAAPDGSFAVEFEASRLGRIVGKSEDYALALEFARHRTMDHRRGEVRWRRRPVPDPATIGHCEIPGPEPLVGGLEWINATNITLARHHNPAMTMRCVNQLHELGKEGALCALREYCEIALSNEEFCQDSTNIDQSHFLRALPICMLLFEPAETPSPLWSEWRETYFGRELRTRWPLFPIVLVEDLPVLLTDDLLGLYCL